MKIYQLLILLLLQTTGLNAQKISGYIRDKKNQPVPGTTVILYQIKDSSVVKINACNNQGYYQFTTIAAGSYFIATSTIGYKNANSGIFNFNGSELDIGTIIIEKQTAQLDEVVVTVKKPMIEVKADKTIFNVESSINAVGNDALDLLRKSPGVVIDREDNIIMSGKSGVNIYIDGKPSPLSGDALSAYLRSLPSSSIDAIELISNPSSKFDAAGNAGIINFKLKKVTTSGTNIAINAGFSYGVYAKYVNGFSINNRRKHFNFFGNYNYNNATNENNLHINRTQADTAFDQYSVTIYRNRGHIYKAGFDYFINKKSTLGLIINGNIENDSITLYSSTPIIYAPTNTINRWLVADNRSIIQNHNNNFNLNYKYAATNGSELNMDADYGFYNLYSDQLQPNYYYDASFTNLISQRIFQFIAPSKISIYSFKTDYEQNFLKGKIAFGGKAALVQAANDFVQYAINNNIQIKDSAKSNDFHYSENINAGYLNFSRQYKKLQLQFGVRIENTNIEGQSNGLIKLGSNWQAYDSSFKRNYTNFFPSAAISFNKNTDNIWGISYSRRIDRPAYQDLNPFEIKIDEYSYYKGNTSLRPQYSNSFSLTYAFKNKLNARLNYSLINDVFARLLDTTELVKSFLIKKNVATQKMFSLNINYNLQKDWYRLNVNLNAYSTRYKADFGKGRTIDLGVEAITVNLQQSAFLGKGWTIEMSGFYNSPSIWSGTFRNRELFGLESGVQKKLFKNKGNLKLSVSDLFRTQVWNSSSNFVGQVMDVEYRWESQLFKMNFTYRLGNMQLKSEIQRKTSADEEGKRVNSGPGGLQN